MSSKIKLFGLLIVLLAALFFVGYKFSSDTHYENTQTGLTLEKPWNWDLTYYERNGVTYLTAENRIFDKGLTHIQIHGYGCRSTHDELANPIEEIEQDIQRIQTLYGLQSVNVIQGPFSAKVGINEVTKAIIDIPKMAMEDDPTTRRVETNGPNLIQAIHIIHIKNLEQNPVKVYIYPGESIELNNQAQKIVDNIKLSCPEPTKP